MSLGSVVSTFAGWARLSRWREWAQSKLPFTAAVAVLVATSAISAPRLLAIVATVAAGAAFGYGLNEVADRSGDARAGKSNSAAGLARWQWASFLAVTAGGALGLSLTWAPDPVAPALVLAGLGLAVAYSVPPLRLKERGPTALAGAAAAQWAMPVLVVSAAEPRGWLRPGAWAFALLGLAIGIRWMTVHQLQDAPADRQAGLRTHAGDHENVDRLLLGVFACELILLLIGLALTWSRSLPGAVALASCAALALALRSRRRPLRARLAGFESAPLAAYYFLALPIALAIGQLANPTASLPLAALLAALALPQLVAAVLFPVARTPFLRRRSSHLIRRVRHQRTGG